MKTLAVFFALVVMAIGLVLVAVLTLITVPAVFALDRDDAHGGRVEQHVVGGGLHQEEGQPARQLEVDSRDRPHVAEQPHALGLADTLFMLLAARVVSGLMSGNISAAFAYVADVTSDDNRGRVVGVPPHACSCETGWRSVMMACTVA